MNICSITYNECKGKYSQKGLRLISKQLTFLKPFPYSFKEQIAEAMARADKISIQGLQPKLSTIFSPKENAFLIVDRNGRYIFKPQHIHYEQIPENESLTMRLAAQVGIKVPLNGLLYSVDNSMTYFIKRFDRTGQKGKIAVEDFAQLLGETRETKYSSSIEKVIEIVNKYCTFPEIEKKYLFKLIIFNYLVGNEDMHLKNYSLITTGDITSISPAYDLVNTTILLGNIKEESALPIAGKKRGLSKNIFFKYLAKERLGLNDKVINKIWSKFYKSFNSWDALINRSFLNDKMKLAYRKIVQNRLQKLSGISLNLRL